jgi:hypothetical protein
VNRIMLVSTVAVQRNQKQALNLLVRILVVSCLGLAPGCSIVQSIDPKGTFSDANLSGSYTYSMAGTRFGQVSGNGLYQEAGTFIGDGNGHISSGYDDFVQGSLASQPFSGSYTIAADGTGTVTLGVGGKTIQWVVTLASDSQLYLVEFDAYGCGGGVARRQTTTAFSTAPSGSFAFRTHNAAQQGSVAKVGSFNLNADGSFAGNEDVLRQGVLLSPSVSGGMTAPDANGRGRTTFLEDTGILSNFHYYVIDANTINLLQVDPNSLGEGRAELRTTSTFSNAGLNGTFVYRSTGDKPTSVGVANSIGAFSSDGNGNILAGNHDSMQDGNPITNLQTTGSYSVDGRGRANILLNSQGSAPIQEVGWLVDSSRGFFLVNSSDRVEDGRLDQQQGTNFAAASLNGQFGFYMSGYDTQSPPLVSRLGILAFDGQGTATFSDYFVNRSGVTTRKGGLSGNYSVSSNGRIAASVPGVTKTLIGYLLSPNSGYLLVGDQGAEEPGKLE